MEEVQLDSGEHLNGEAQRQEIVSPYPRHLRTHFNASFVTPDWNRKRLITLWGLVVAILLGVSGTYIAPAISALWIIVTMIPLGCFFYFRSKPPRWLVPESNLYYRHDTDAGRVLEELAAQEHFKFLPIAIARSGVDSTRLHPAKNASEITFSEGLWSHLEVSQIVAVSAMMQFFESKLQRFRIVAGYVLILAGITAYSKGLLDFSRIDLWREWAMIYLFVSGTTYCFAFIPARIASFLRLRKLGLVENYRSAKRIQKELAKKVPWYFRVRF